ncbi:cation:proton antiporter [Vagococcus carniphilus]|uniref:cation:proton antiporter n=1 Tax=Vagococcus carniphilus TaxID=218144 RepID=UPI00288ED588|nr:cation:proton antiporter [Vagococcus carniphilus]MDT2866117.1 cation:proton antiporter [Vagococcus carniphilus]
MLMELLLALILIIVGTKFASHLCHRIGIPAVIGELLTGVILGPALLGWVAHTDTISIFAEVGVILLMFLAGLESDLEKLKKYLTPSVMVALFGIIFPMIFISGAAHLFDIPWKEAIFLGVIFSATSVSISVQVLKEYKRLDTAEGSVTLGAAVVDDIAVVLIVSIFSAVLSMDGNTSSMGVGFIWDLLGTKILFFIGLYLFAKFILDPLLSLTKKIVAVEAETAFALALCFGFAILSEHVGMSDVIGAFFIGLLLSRQEGKHEIEHNVSVISYSVFIPVFFVSIGLDIELSAFKEYAVIIIVFTLLATLTKLIGGYLGGRVTKLDRNQSLIIGAGMVSRGEMALIIVKMGENLGLINEGLYSAIVVAIILTTLFSPLLIKYAIEKGTPA